VDLILDTNALSAVAEGYPEIARLVGAAAQPAIPVIVLGEYRFGIAGSRFRIAYEGWLKKYLPTYAVLRIDEETAVEYAGLRVELKAAGTPIPSNDMWIAALCRQHSRPILSRDRHFDLVRGLRRLAW
jgi:tRNA(fMet)-specific endonuclease VapC